MRVRVRAMAGVVVMMAGLVMLGASAGGCGRQTASRHTAREVLGPDHRFSIKVGDQTVSLRLAVHETEQARGLMNVPSMPEMEGMLFVYAKPRLMSFYMRNCVFPQDIGFFDSAGVLREVHPMYPGVEDSVRSRSDQMQFALEMNQGWYAKHHVLPGAKIDLGAVREALKQRGYDPEKFVAGK